MAFLWWRFGDPLLFAHTQLTHWHHQVWPLWRTAYVSFQHVAAHRAGLLPVDAAAVLGFAAVTLAAARRAPFSFTLFMAGLLYLSVSAPVPGQSDLIASAGRYLTAAAPAFLAIGRWTRTRPWLDLAVVAGGFLLQAVLLETFLAGGPVL
jgi:hypothetical protein